MSRPPNTPEQIAEGKKLADSLRRARERTNAPQTDLASRSGISIDMIRKIERNAITAPSFQTVARLAKQLSVPLDALADEVLDRTPPVRRKGH